MTERQRTKGGGRLASLGWRSAAIAAAAAVTGIGALVVLGDPAPQAPRYTVGESENGSAPSRTDPLRSELARCTTLPAETEDARCRAAWEANRRRFMGKSRSFIAPVEAEPSRAAAPPATPIQTQGGER